MAQAEVCHAIVFGSRYSLLCRDMDGCMSHPDSGSDPLSGSEPVLGCKTQDWDSLPDFFFFYRTCICGYGPFLITESKYHIHLLSPIYLYKTVILHYKSEHGTYM